MRAPISSTLAGRCRICASRAACGFSMCASCRDVAVRLGRPPVPVAAAAFVTGASPLYRALRQYKSGEPDVAARQLTRLTALLERFFARHGGCIAPDGVDATVVVPSTRNRRPPPHPLTRLVGGAALPPLLDALGAGDDEITHRLPSARGYLVTEDVAECRILLVDDVYTSGAHLQSAAAALADAGAPAVHALTLGRYVRDRAPRPSCGCCRR